MAQQWLSLVPVQFHLYIASYNCDVTLVIMIAVATTPSLYHLDTVYKSGCQPCS